VDPAADPASISMIPRYDPK